MQYLFLLICLSSIQPHVWDDSRVLYAQVASTSETIDYPILPGDPVNPIQSPGFELIIQDASFSFDLSVNININSSFQETLQTAQDFDYYRYEAYHYNYIQFNISSYYTSAFTGNVNVYKNNNHVTPIYTYQNSTTSDLSSIPVIYVEPGDVYYFVYNKYNYVKPSGPRTPTYTASVINAAVADVPENQFDSAGYVDDQEVFGYNNNTVKVYSESSCNAIHDSSNTYLQLIEDAMSEWNKVGCLQFVSTNSRSEANIFVKCTFDGENGTTGSYFHYNRTPKTGGELSINRSYCDGYSYSYVLDTIIHEFGHSIGFGHINYAYGANVMYYRTSDYVSFGQGDLAVYHYKWGLLQ